MSRHTSDYDESDVRVRPSRRGSRPRSKDRPSHDNAVPGFVTAVDRGRYTVLVGAGVGGRTLPERLVTAMKARELGRKGIVVGDEVGLVGEVAGGPDSLARIVKLTPRTTVLRRTADDTDPVERVIVANADQLVIVSALANPEPRPRLIDRCLVAAYDAGLAPLLVLTKADLADPADFLANYAPLEVPYVITSTEGDGFDGLEALQDKLIGRVSVFVGHSGVGKSTLVNGLVPEAHRAIGVVNVVTGRGRHTSTSCPATRAGSSTRPACAPSGSPTSTSSGSSCTSPTSSGARPRAPAAARTTRRSAASTRGSPPARPARPDPPGSSRCGGCCGPALAKVATRGPRLRIA
jgi:ribosome biogenesis GTPase